MSRYIHACFLTILVSALISSCGLAPVPPTPTDTPSPAPTLTSTPTITLTPSTTSTPTPTDILQNLPTGFQAVINANGIQGIGVVENGQTEVIPGVTADATGLHLLLPDGTKADFTTSTLGHR